MVSKITLGVLLLIAASQFIMAIAYPHYSSLFPQLLTSRDASQSVSTIPLTSQNCIAPNPDITGIGVRISIYIQSFLSFALAFTFASDSFVDSHEEKVLHKVYINLLITASALLLSAFIQAATSELSVYHALIVLNLCWMVTTSALIIFIFPTIHWRSSQSLGGWAQRLWPSNVKQLPVVLLVPTYFCATASLGIWVWTKIAAFGINPECIPETFTTVFAHDISVTNRSLRIVSLVIYAIAAIPGINIAIFTAIAGACSAGVVFAVTSISTRTWFTYRPLYLMAVVIQAFISALFIADTELMIYRSRPLVADGESAWTFGQTLALVLVIVPLLEVVNMMQPKVQGTDRTKRVVFYLEWWLRGRLRESGQSWDIFYDGVAEDIFQARQFVSTQRANLTTSSSPVSHAFAAAEAALTAAEAGLASANAILRLDVPSTSLAAKTPPTVIYIPNVRKATEKIARTREGVVKGRNLRFSEVYRNPSHFFAAKASLDVVKSSLDAAKAALETANAALNDSSISTGSSERPARSSQENNSSSPS